jgi:glycosidase
VIRRRGRPLRAPLAAIALLLAACAAPQPRPTVSPNATPSPTLGAAPTSVVVTPSPSPPPRHAVDGEIDAAGLRHDSRDLLYRTPGGAVPTGTAVTVRLRTFWNDVGAVQLRLFSLNSSQEALIDMTREADGVSCYEAALDDPGDRCDYWSATLDNGAADNLWYRFIISDGDQTIYYADDGPALDGGPGAATAAEIDNSYALLVHEPGLEVPDWARQAVVYQIFPDRFRNGDPANDPATGDRRYDDPVLKLEWSDLPEGHCRGYADASDGGCPWRFDDSPPSWSPDVEGPRGRDYFGGDLAGVIEQLPYLQALGVTAIYFNPIFDAGSNHGYDTQDYERIEPYFGTNEDFAALVAAAEQHGIRLILDGVFNHTSSDSPWFDRYGHYDTVGACEAVDSEWRAWYYMTTARGPCVGDDGEGDASYQSWFGFDTLPMLLKNQPELRDYFIDGEDSIARRWLQAGATGWRLDVAGDPSFPRAYWPEFRAAVKSVRPDALTISETWQKDSALLRNVRGDRLDTTMNYRLRDAVLGLLAPQAFDAKGFPDSGQGLTASEFAARLLAQQEDYAPATYYTLMNLLDSHDTERVLWTLTPGAETRQERELDAANVAEGKARLRLASLLQFSVAGMPTIYYGDEVGLTGDDDPDDRRTYPWAELGGNPDSELLAHYRALAQLRRDLPALVDGDLRVLLADDEQGIVVLGRRTADEAVLIAVNSSAESRTVSVPTDALIAPGTTLDTRFTVGEGNTAAQPDGALELTLAPLGAVVMSSAADADVAPPPPPAELTGSRPGDGVADLAWLPSAGAVSYNVYRSPLSGGGWVRVNAAPLRDAAYRDEGLDVARPYHYAVTALDEAGNESGYSAAAVVAPPAP